MLKKQKMLKHATIKADMYNSFHNKTNNLHKKASNILISNTMTNSLETKAYTSNLLSEANPLFPLHQ